MKKQYIISIVLNDSIIETVSVMAYGESMAYDIVFEYVDLKYGIRNDYELFNRLHPRHNVLFKDVSNFNNENIIKDLKQ